ncbi:MAG: hypothetical protein WD928_13245 [Gammaproteobacteria bacterium]
MPLPAPLSACCIGFVAGLLACAWSGAAPAVEFEFGSYRIMVEADTSGVMTTNNYEISVANPELTLTRLIAPHPGRLSKSYVADLDRDGAFEVVVTFSHSEGQQTGLHLYTWEAYLLQPVRVAALEGPQLEGYRGGDEFAVVDGELVRVFQIHQLVDGHWQPTAAQRRLRYALREARWVADR